MNDSAISKEAVVIERILDAPADLVWKLWTEPGHFKNWYGPQGAGVPVADFDLRVGGIRMVCMEMQTPNGAMKMCTVGVHIEISPTTRLVYTESMADEQGNAMEMPGMPSETRVTVILEDLGGRTRMVMTHAGIPADSPGASGWEMAFDKLTDYLGSMDS